MNGRLVVRLCDDGWVVGDYESIDCVLFLSDP